MTSLRRSIFPISFGATISLIAALDQRAFSVLNDDIRGSSGFETDARRVSRLAEATDLDAEIVQAILQVIGFMYEQVHRRASEELSAEEIRDLIVQELDVEEGQETERLYERLELLLRRDQSIEDYRRRRELKAGFLTRAVGFSSVVDLRPDFATDERPSVKLVPLLQFRVDTDSDSDSGECLVFQLDERALAELEEAVRIARERLNSLRSDPVLSPTLSD